MKWLATEVVEVAVAMAVAVEVEVDAGAVEVSPAQTLRLWVEIVVGRPFILLSRTVFPSLSLVLTVIPTIVDSHISMFYGELMPSPDWQRVWSVH